MILAALFLLATPAQPPADLQIMISPAFERFAGLADAMCPSQKLRFLTPGDLDDLEESFEAQLSPTDRHRLAAADKGTRGCANQYGGLSCPAQHTLDAMARLDMLSAFTRSACSMSRARATGG